MRPLFRRSRVAVDALPTRDRYTTPEVPSWLSQSERAARFFLIADHCPDARQAALYRVCAALCSATPDAPTLDHPEGF